MSVHGGDSHTGSLTLHLEVEGTRPLTTVVASSLAPNSESSVRSGIPVGVTTAVTAPGATRNLGGPSRETTAPLLTTELPVADRPVPPVVQPTRAVQPPGVTPFHVPLLGQLPQIPRFTGEGHGSGESFSKWHEHFENIAKLVGWDDHLKLVHFTLSNLRDTAYIFHVVWIPSVQ